VKPERRRWCSSALRALLATSLFALLAAAAGAKPAGRVDVYLFWAIGALLLLRPEWLMFG